MSSMSVTHEQFSQCLTEMRVARKHSNMRLEIYEENNQTSAGSSTPSEERASLLYKSIDVHDFVLWMSSSYFDGRFTEEGIIASADRVVQVTVGDGQGEALERIVSLFYDQELLETLTLVDLLRILEIASKFTNEGFVKLIVDRVNGVLQISDTAECDDALQKITALETDGCVSRDLLQVAKAKCASFLANIFAPLESNQKQHTQFLELKFTSLHCLLVSDEKFVMSENSLLAFVISWLEYDSMRQTSSVIEALLTALRIKDLSVDFLTTVITSESRLLNVWPQFNNWFIKCLSFHGLTAALRKLKYPAIEEAQSHCVDHGTSAWIKSAENVSACRWIVQMTPEQPSIRFGPINHLLVHDGYSFSPESINVLPSDGKPSKRDLSLTITGNGTLRDVRFVVGIIPGNVECDASKMLLGSKFSEKLLTLTSLHNFNGESLTVNLWTVATDLLDVLNEHGIWVCLLPIFSEEYQQLSFKCVHGAPVCLNENCLQSPKSCGHGWWVVCPNGTSGCTRGQACPHGISRCLYDNCVQPLRTNSTKLHLITGMDCLQQ